MSNRDELIRELKKHLPCTCIDAYKLRVLSAPDCAHCNYVEDVADFIIERERKIVSPLVKIRGTFSNMGWVKLNQVNLRQAIDETLKLSGVFNGKG